MKEFKKKIFLAVANKLSIYGFKKKGFSEIIRKADNHTIQTLTFGMSSGGELHSVFVRPIISVTYKDAEKLFQQFGVWGAGRIGCNIGYLMPQNYYIEWRFNREEDPAVNLNEMCEVIIQ